MALTPQTFNPDNVMLRDSLGARVNSQMLTDQFMDLLLPQSALMRLGTPIEMAGEYYRSTHGIDSELSDAYFVGEGQKIQTAKITTAEWSMSTVKIGVILPVTDEFLAYTWSDYFSAIVPMVADKFYKRIDGAAFLGLNGNPFGSNILSAATNAGNVIEGDITVENLYALQDAIPYEGTAYVSNKNSERSLHGLVDPVAETRIFQRPDRLSRVGSLDSYPYVRLDMGNDNPEFTDGTILYGDFSKIYYGLPRGNQLRMKLDDSATLSTITNTDGSDVNLFEQEMHAMRFTFDIAVAVPPIHEEHFAVLQAEVAGG